MDWRDFLTGKHARDDLFDSFPPAELKDLQPALLNDSAVVAAARVGTEVLRVVAKRGGTRLDTGTLDRLASVLDDVLPDSAVNLCEDEAARVLDWLERDDDHPPAQAPASSLPPELDLMLGADIDSRISVARLALEEGYDVELEYFDEATKRWPRVRCKPIELVDAQERSGEGELEERSEVMLAVEREDERAEVPVRSIRWLMPVTPTRPPTVESDEEGEVVEFPGPTADQRDGDGPTDGDGPRSDD